MNNKDHEQVLPTKNFSRFEQYLEMQGLPTENVVANESERLELMKLLDSFLKKLDPETKKDARYLSKFIASSAVGLYDAALNFVWNEVIVKLRDRIVVYGLDIFYDAAIGEKRRDQFKNPEDLKGINDQQLLDTCKKLELISDIAYKKLSHILTMRNYIGASHPNTYSIGIYELLSWLETCIEEVIDIEPSRAAIEIKKIIHNIRTSDVKFSEDTISNFADSIEDLSTEMTGNLLKTLFGIYCDKSKNKIVRSNILKIAPYIWEHCLDEIKYDLGEKIDYYSSNLDTEKKDRGESFIDYCGGNRYLSLDKRIIELSSLCDDLIEATNGYNNYYNEPPIVREIMKFIEKPEDIPTERQSKIIKTFLECRIGREVEYKNGVSPGAKRYYDNFFEILNKNQIKELLRLLEKQNIKVKFQTNIRRQNMIEILEIIKTPLIGDRLNEVIDFIIENKENMFSLFDSTDYKQLTKFI